MLTSIEKWRYQMKLPIEKGLAEGIKKGLAEGQLKTRIEMIYAMIANGLDDERISRITKEPLEEVTRIRKEVKN